jgi:hypothetical protein
VEKVDGRSGTNVTQVVIKNRKNDNIT